MLTKIPHLPQRIIALALIVLLSAQLASAGIQVIATQGVTATGVDGITFTGMSGVTATGVDGLLAFTVNGITATGVDGVTATGVDGVTATGVDGVTATGVDGVIYRGLNGVTATGVDGVTATGVDGVTATGVDGVTITTSDGTSYHADTVTFRQATGVTATGVDGVTATGVDGVTATGVDSRDIKRADGVTATGVDSLTITSADGVTATGVDGVAINISPDGVTVTGADGVTATGVDGLRITRADGITATGVDGVTATGVDGVTATGVDGQSAGLQSLDPELALTLNQLTDDSSVNAIIVFHRPPTEADFAELQRIGIMGGMRFRVLPMIYVTATREQIFAVSRLQSVRSIYGNRTLQPTNDPARALAGVERARSDGELTTRNSGLPVSGRGVTVAVLDTGIDATHADLTGRVAQNVKLGGAQSASVGFQYPASTEGLPNTDQLHGHGTFVAGLIAGSGVRSNGRWQGVAPGAQVLGLSAGDLNLFFVLEGFDYILERGAQAGVRVVNCSFSANTVFDYNDPVNIATKMLTERGVSVVFSAGNTGAGLHTLNPYAVAPWVVSVGATDAQGRLAGFSSRGRFANPLFRPTLVAPGVGVVSLRSSTAPSLTGALGVENDAGRLSAGDLPFYTTSSGTSFSAPQVAGTIALMLEVNPRLTPTQVRDILQRSATPLPAYYAHEVGAGMLNAHAAVLEAAFAERRMGMWRATLDRGQVRFISDAAQQFAGTAQPGTPADVVVNVPQNSIVASAQIAWGPLLTPNDLGLALLDPNGARRAEANTINLPGLTGRRERAAVNQPAAGAWRARVAHTLGAVSTPQSFVGVLEVGRVEYALLRDLNGLSAQARAAIEQTLRSFVLLPVSNQHFRPDFAVTRAELAAALVRAGRAPQYLPARANYTDVRDAETMLYVESAQGAPGGAFFVDAAAGSRFRPHEDASRLAAAVALVRAAGLRQEAEAKANVPLALADTNQIPAELRGYVAVALARGFLTAEGGSFHPQRAITRAECAQGLAALINLAVR